MFRFTHFTRFMFRLPRPITKGMTKRILIVDDSDQLRKALRAALESELGVTCTEARNGRDAVNRARELNPDLIVLDLSMPVMNGLDAAPHLKRLLPAVPIVMFTSPPEQSSIRSFFSTVRP